MARFRVNAAKAMKDRVRTLQSKATELHDIIRSNKDLRLSGLVATLVQTKSGGWDIFLSNHKHDEFPIDFARLDQPTIKYPWHYRSQIAAEQDCQRDTGILNFTRPTEQIPEATTSASQATGLQEQQQDTVGFTAINKPGTGQHNPPAEQARSEMNSDGLSGAVDKSPARQHSPPSSPLSTPPDSPCQNAAEPRRMVTRSLIAQASQDGVPPGHGSTTEQQTHTTGPTDLETHQAGFNDTTTRSPLFDNQDGEYFPNNEMSPRTPPACSFRPLTPPSSLLSETSRVTGSFRTPLTRSSRYHINESPTPVHRGPNALRATDFAMSYNCGEGGPPPDYHEATASCRRTTAGKSRTTNTNNCRTPVSKRRKKQPVGGGFKLRSSVGGR